MSDSENTLVLEQFLPFRLSRLSEAVSLKFAAHYKRAYGMTRPEWRALAALGQHGNLTSSQICRYCNMHKTKVSRAVQALFERGWLTRSRDAADRRVEYLQLTDKGRKNYIKLIDLANSFEKELTAPLSASAQATVSKALKLLEGLAVLNINDNAKEQDNKHL